MALITYSSARQPAESDDCLYINWRNNNPNGFVLAFTLPAEGYVTLHSAECRHIASPRRSGAYTRGNYGKHCAETWQGVEQFMARSRARVEECRSCSGLRERAKKAWEDPRSTPSVTTKQRSAVKSTPSYAPPPYTAPKTQANDSSITNVAIVTVADYCRNHLDLSSSSELQGDPYKCVPVCVVDAVFSIGVRYESTEAVVRRFCRYFDLPYSGPKRLPDPKDQLSVTDFLRTYEEYGIDRMTLEVYCNRQRTSSRSGILKSEAVLRFSQVLHDHGVNYLQDVDKIIGSPSFEADIRLIPGQRSGISLRYFYMLAGSDDFIKPDRMIRRFLYKIIGRQLADDDCHHLIVGAHSLLVEDFPSLTPKSLDHLIWRHERMN